jgi:hypothetical protein
VFQNAAHRNATGGLGSPVPTTPDPPGLNRINGHDSRGTASRSCVVTSSPSRDSVNRCVIPLRPPAPERLFSFRPKTRSRGTGGLPADNISLCKQRANSSADRTDCRCH